MLKAASLGLCGCQRLQGPGNLRLQWFCWLSEGVPHLLLADAQAHRPLQHPGAAEPRVVRVDGAERPPVEGIRLCQRAIDVSDCQINGLQSGVASVQLPARCGAPQKPNPGLLVATASAVLVAVRLCLPQVQGINIY